MRKIIFPYEDQKNKAVKLDTEKSVRICESEISNDHRYVLYRKKGGNVFFFVDEHCKDGACEERDLYWPGGKVYRDMTFHCFLNVGSTTWDGHIHSVKQFVAAYASVETYEQWFGKLPD